MRSDTYQVLLILAGVIVATLFGAFLYREIFPEYRIYQKDYLALEEFRSTYTHQALPPFKGGIKQIVLEREDRGPAIVDRCTSCHVALQVPYFSPTKIAHDLNGNIVRDTQGHPVLEPNEEYIWQKLDEKIAELRDKKVLEQLKSQGETKEVSRRLDLAASYESLKTAHVGHAVYDVTKVLAMHPLMGNETRPFEYHPVEEYGCTSCHNGNGRGLVTDKAHGPVFDEHYEAEDEGPTPLFTESDPKNDPRFARVFNEKPGAALLFQTEPLFVGALIQAKCMQCHQTSDMRLTGAVTSASELTQQRQAQLITLTEAYEKEKQAALDLLKLQQLIRKQGYTSTWQELQVLQIDYALPPVELEHVASQINYLKQASQGQVDNQRAAAHVLPKINQDLIRLIGSDALVQKLEESYQTEGVKSLDSFLKDHPQDPQAKGTLFAKAEALAFNQELMRHAQEAEKSFAAATSDRKVMSALTSTVDELTRNYQRGKDLYLSQACYACHRISGFARGGVGPELTRIGESYPWYVKKSIVWPQADLLTSTMPNMRMDHQELEDLMAFLLAQKGGNRAVAQTAYQAALQAWEAGRKMPWEKPIPPSHMYDLRYALTIFATEGCASCHRLQGFESNVGFKVEKESASLDQVDEQQKWFKKLFPEVVHYTNYDEQMPGSEIVAHLEQHAQEIDARIVADVRQNGLIEEINRDHPEVIESLYSNFRYASRAKNDHYQTVIDQEKDPKKVAQLKEEWQSWKERVHRVLMIYIQTYGLGRLIGPHLNWSGIYRTDEWLMEHFRNPSGHVPHSIMPILPFDDTKFYALTYLLDQLAVHNRATLRQLWKQRGFDPEEAYEMLCSQCHGIGMRGNGVIAEWIYPIPKNLHNPEFLRNLTREKVVYSITHGVKGTPMPPWGEVALHKPSAIQKLSSNSPVLNEAEIDYLVDWLFSSLPGGEVIRQASDVPKWQYTPQDVLHELQKEGGKLSALSQEEMKQKNIGEQIFDVVPQPTDTGTNSYYIKKKFYTPYNIEEGQKFFLINCAVCHGNEGDGSGARGSAMQEAKPRMLTNLDWVRSRDDLRILRSIKYGVPGTSMTPWGELTNSLQRLQLVMFIRSLTQEKDRRDQLEQAVYQAFEIAQFTIEDARIERSQQIEKLQQEAQQLQEQQRALENKVTEGKGSAQEVIQIYQQGLEVDQKIRKLQEQDQQLVNLKMKVKKERELYFNLGVNLITKNVSDEILQAYLNLIRLNAQRYSLQDHQLNIHPNKQVEEHIRATRQAILQELDQQPQTDQAARDNVKKLKAKLVTDTEEALRLAQQQVDIVHALNSEVS
jgi:mono/diheme cytochrome c family protein